MRTFLVAGLGEVLWDIFPEHIALGGAPSNFAYISSLLGDRGTVVSRIGSDEYGQQIEERFRELGLSADSLQVDGERPTGTVQVEVSPEGQPAFEIVQPVAWDFLEWTLTLEELAMSVDAVCFGTLAQRDPHTRSTIQQFLRATRPDAIRIFDVNLRQSFYSEETLMTSAEVADIVKLNHEEVPVVMGALGQPQLKDVAAARWLAERFALKLVCITRGGAGSVLVQGEEVDEHTGFAVQVVDTVGAGDAFTATMVHHFLRGSSLARMNEAANRMGSWVASRRGATPTFWEEELEQVRA